MPDEPVRWKCPVCEKTGFKMERYVKTHMKLKHPELEGSSYPAPVKDVPEDPPEEAVVDPPKDETEEEHVDPGVTVKEVEGGVSVAPTGSLPLATAPSGEIDIDTNPENSLSVTYSPPPPASETRLLSVPLGSVLLLNGPAWWQSPDTKSWDSSEVSDLTVQVVGKEVPQNDVVLLCRAQNSAALWAILEKSVLDGETKVVKLAPVEPSMGALGFKPEDGPRDFRDPAYDYFGEERVAEEARQRAAQVKEQFLKDVREYAEASEAASKAAREFEEIRKTHRESIMNYVREFGSPPENGKSGIVVKEGGYEVHISVTPGPTYTESDETRICQWLSDKEYHTCMKLVLDQEKWERLKEERDDDGAPLVPHSFLTDVEVRKTGEGTERLIISPLPE